MGQQDGQIVGGQPDGRKEDQRRDGDEDFGPFRGRLISAKLACRPRNRPPRIIASAAAEVTAVAVVEVITAMVSEFQAV
ncbi:MAG: hypothetical protein WBP18_13720 [Paracoccaceae bacterium]